MEKIDLKKELKGLYSPAKKIKFVEVPAMKYIKIDGKGSPNEENGDFSNAMSALYPLVYTMKFMLKDNGKDFVVMPLEGLWYADDYEVYQTMETDKWKWTVMIAVPNFVETTHFEQAREKATDKIPADMKNKLQFAQLNEGSCFQITHIGPYSEEAETVKTLHKHIEMEGYEFAGLHHEIYLSDPRKTAPENLKTLIRQPVKKTVS